MSLLLVGSVEGGEWKKATVFAQGNEDSVRQMFAQRKRPFIIWYLIDTEKLTQDYNNYKQLDLLFFDAKKTYPDLAEVDYRHEPFVGFYDMIAAERSWGALKNFAEQEEPSSL